MSTQEENTVENSSQPELSFGAILTKARQEKSLSAVDLADRLNLGANVVEQLEAEDFDALPAPAFVRGYLRAIATELGLDADTLLASYIAKSTVDDPDLSSTSAAVKQKGTNDPLMIWGSLIILLLILSLLVIWVLGMRDQSEPQASVDEGVEEATVSADMPTGDRLSLSLSQPVVEKTPASEEALEEEAPDVEGTPDGEGALDDDAEISDAETPDGEEAADSEIQVTDEPQEVATTEAAADSAPARIRTQSPAGKDILVITVGGPSWADVSDATGFKLVYGLLDSKNKTITLKGQAPFRVFLGDATQVGLQFNGAKFDFSGSVRANKVARFFVR